MVAGGVHDCVGACVVVGGMHDCKGHAWLGACMVAEGCAWLQGACMGYDEIRSMSVWYASYWNAFLFHWIFTCRICDVIGYSLVRSVM